MLVKSATVLNLVLTIYQATIGDEVHEVFWIFSSDTVSSALKEVFNKQILDKPTLDFWHTWDVISLPCPNFKIGLRTSRLIGHYLCIFMYPMEA